MDILFTVSVIGALIAYVITGAAKFSKKMQFYEESMEEVVNQAADEEDSKATTH